MSATLLLPIATILSLVACTTAPSAPTENRSTAEQEFSKLLSIRVAGFVKASGIT